MDQKFIENLAKYIDQIRNTFQILQPHTIQPSLNNEIIIKPAKYLTLIFKKFQEDFKKYLSILSPILIDVKIVYLPDSIILYTKFKDVPPASLIKLPDVTNLMELPDDVIYSILIDLPYQEIRNFCTISFPAYEICLDNKFWRRKFIHDFGYNIPNPTLHMETAYVYHNSLWTFGNNQYGQLGYGYNKISDSFDVRKVPFPIGIHVKEISFGKDFSIIIDNNGDIWSVGKNDNRQCGFDNIEKIIPEYRKLDIDAKFIKISASDLHVLALDNNGTIWSWGSNYSHVLGRTDTQKIISKIILINKIIYIASGHFGCFAIDEFNNLFGWGKNSSMPLGLDVTLNSIITPTLIPNIQAKYIHISVTHSLLIDNDDNVWSIGNNISGQLGLGDNINRYTFTKINNIKAKTLSCGDKFSIIIDMNNNVYSFGLNLNGQLGLNNLQSYNTPQLIEGIQAKDVSCGHSYVLLIDMDHKLWSFGYNKYGQLGYIITPLNKLTIYSLPNTTPSNIALKRNSVIKPRHVNLTMKVKKISAGYDHSGIIVGFDRNL